MVVSCWDGSELRTVRLPALPEDLLVVVAVPDVQVKTREARAALPEQVCFGDAVFTLGRAALLTAAWATGQWDLLAWGMDDRLHQPYRAKLFPGGRSSWIGFGRFPAAWGWPSAAPVPAWWPW